LAAAFIAQVVKNGHQCGKKDDDRQHVDGKTESDDIRVRQRAEDHVDAGFRIPDHGQHAGAKPGNGATSPVEIQHKRRNRRLQGKRRDDDPEMNRFAIARERYRDCEYDDNAKDSDQVTRHGWFPRDDCCCYYSLEYPIDQPVAVRIR
jgi:hypothetical protein